MARKRTEVPTRAIAMACVAEVQRLKSAVVSLRKRVRALEKEEQSAEVIGFRVDQAAEDPDVEEMP